MGVETMNLTESSDGGMVPLHTTSQQKRVENQQPVPEKSLIYSAKIEEQEKKQVPNNNKQMDSTPLSDIVSGNEMLMDQGAPVMAQDPRMMAAAVQQPAQVMSVAAQQMVAEPAQQKAQEVSKNPMNLTDEQMDALVAGVCAVVAFSAPVQGKMSDMIPRFTTSSGERSTTGLVATGLVAAIVFYLAKNFVLKK